MTEEEREQARLRGRQVEGVTSPSRMGSLLVDEQVSDLERLAERTGTSQHRSHAREQLFEGKRLHEVVISSEREPEEAIFDRVACCEEDDRQLPA